MLRRESLRVGFTLIELLLVLALLVVVAGFTAMALEGSLLRSKMQEAEEHVRTVWNDARLATINSGQQRAFTCMIGRRDYRVATCGQLSVPAEGQTPNAAAPQTGQLPEGVVFRSLRAAASNVAGQASVGTPLTDGDWSPPVVFDPDGGAYDAVVVLEDEQGRQIQITLRGLTCTAEVRPMSQVREAAR